MTMAVDSAEATLHRLYQAFARLDVVTMAECYAPDATFQDPVFRLSGKDEVVGMWNMLCTATLTKAPQDWRLVHQGVQTSAGPNGVTGQAQWDAWYRFSATGRLVHNRIQGQFVFNEQGLIVRHHDQFDFWRWARHALGPAGWLLGWSPTLRYRVRSQAHYNLKRFTATNPPLCPGFERP